MHLSNSVAKRTRHNVQLSLQKLGRSSFGLHRFLTLSAECLALLLSILLIARSRAQSVQPIQYQTNHLEFGWNLLAFQVLPTNPSPSAVFDTNQFRAAWTFDNATGQWTQYGRASAHNQVLPIGNIELGKAYWVYYDQSFSTDWVIPGLVPEAAFSLVFTQGWNLVGVPGDAASADLGVLSIFKPGDLEKIQLIARWEAANQKFQVYDPKRPEVSDFQLFNPNLGHWIKATEALSIQPDLVVDAPGDEDLPPVTFPPLTNGMPWTPGPEDVDIGLPGDPPVFEDKSIQTVIKIPKGVDASILPIYNRGGGIVLWNVRVLEGASRASAVGLTAEQASMVVSLSQSHGVTSSETDTLKISVDRTHLSPGTYLAQLNISASTGQSKTFHLVIETGGLDGQWAGEAAIATVNGKANVVADIDLFIHLFQDNKPGSRQIRGIIDSQETLLWPVDAQLLGHLTDAPAGNFDPSYASRFVISGGFTMPPGDVNHHPFETFPDTNSPPAMDPDTGLEFLSNAEGDRWYHTLADRLTAPNFLNPFPRFISREVELIGQLTGTEGGRAVATGEYYETVTGMTPTPILLRGTFRLIRQSPSPLERRPYKYFAATPQNGFTVAAATSFTNSLSVPDHVLIRRALIVVAQDASATEHTLRLIGPNGVAVVLHGGQAAGTLKSVIYDSGDLPLDSLTLLDPPELRGAMPLPMAQGTSGLDVGLYERQLRESLASYGIRHPRQSLAVFNDLDAYGTWRLEYRNNNSGAIQKLLGWSLLVYGVAAYSVSGQVIVEGSSDPNRFSNVSLQVLGLNADLDANLTDFNRTSGVFTIRCLPAVRANVAAYKPGYVPATIDGLNTPMDPRGFRDGLGGILLGGPGTANIRLTLRLPPPTTAPRVFTYQQNLPVTGSSGLARVADATVALSASGMESDIRWTLEWLGTASPTNWTVVGQRSPTISVSIPVSAFTLNNNFTVAYRAVATSIATGQVIARGEWVTVTLQNPGPPTNVNAYWNTVLVQGTVLTGFGAVAAPVIDPATNSPTAWHAQKTDVAKVDVDRSPLIDGRTNPSFEFSLDGLTGNGDGEDTDLSPRTFNLHVPPSLSRFAYADIVATPEGRFTVLAPPLPGQNPAYDDINNGISGRDINQPGEPVRIYTAIGGHFCNLGVSGANGSQRVSAGANPGKD
jgi:hypothetical protein